MLSLERFKLFRWHLIALDTEVQIAGRKFTIDLGSCVPRAWERLLRQEGTVITLLLTCMVRSSSKNNMLGQFIMEESVTDFIGGVGAVLPNQQWWVHPVKHVWQLVLIPLHQCTSQAFRLTVRCANCSKCSSSTITWMSKLSDSFKSNLYNILQNHPSQRLR